MNIDNLPFSALQVPMLADFDVTVECISIFLSCSPRQQLCPDKNMTARRSWDALTDLFQPSFLNTIFHLVAKFNVLRLTLQPTCYLVDYFSVPNLATATPGYTGPL